MTRQCRCRLELMATAHRNFIPLVQSKGGHPTEWPRRANTKSKSPAGRCFVSGNLAGMLFVFCAGSGRARSRGGRGASSRETIEAGARPRRMRRKQKDGRRGAFGAGSGSPSGACELRKTIAVSSTVLRAGAVGEKVHVSLIYFVWV